MSEEKKKAVNDKESLLEIFIKKVGAVEHWSARECSMWYLVNKCGCPLDFVISNIGHNTKIGLLSIDQFCLLGRLIHTGLENDISKNELTDIVNDVIDFSHSEQVMFKVLELCINGIYIGFDTTQRILLPYSYAKVVLHKYWDPIDANEYQVRDMLDLMMLVYRRDLDHRINDILVRARNLWEFKHIIKACIYKAPIDEIKSVMVLDSTHKRDTKLKSLIAKYRLGYTIGDLT